MLPKTLAAVVSVCLWSAAQAEPWMLRDTMVISTLGTQPSVWEDTVAYTEGTGGGVWLWEDGTSTHIFGPTNASYEPTTTFTGIAWRNSTGGVETNEVYYWNGQTTYNISNTPGIKELHLASGNNGDFMWCQADQWLYYYDSSAGVTSALGLRGDYPSLYLRDDGVLTYAYQDPDTEEIKYFDGTTTITLGAGKPSAGKPSLWNGVVAWVGVGEGSALYNSEIFYWAEGMSEPLRLTNDSGNGVGDEYPQVWNDVVVWSRCAAGPFGQRLWLYDGTQTIQLGSMIARFPNYRCGRVAWVAGDGLYTAELRRVVLADCNADGDVDILDFMSFTSCCEGPDNGPLGTGCTCADLDGPDGDADLMDFALLQEEFGPSY